MAILTDLRKVLLSSACLMIAISGTQANAQGAGYYDNNVTVDLSVLDDNGRGSIRRSIANPDYSGAKLPPVEKPKSTFHGIPAGAKPALSMTQPKLQSHSTTSTQRIVLQRPSAAPQAPALPTTRLAKTNPKPLAPKEVKITPPEAPMVEVVKETPKPIAPKIETTQAEPPKPIAAPTKPVTHEVIETVKAAEPTPLAKVVTPPAPEKVMADAPPPPPPSAIEPQNVESTIKAEAKKEASKAVASLPSASQASVRIAFQENQSKLPSSSEANLKELAANLMTNPDDRVQLLAYAGGENLAASKARRLSLSRALAVRSYLIGEGVRSTRIDVRALGNKTTEEPFDRVDVQIAPR